MNLTIPLVCALAPCLLAPCEAAGQRAFANLIGTDGQAMGRARLTSISHGVLIEIEMHGLSPGAHGVSVHATGACDAAGGFASAGPIASFDSMRAHGFLAKGGPRTGDLPNQYAAADGTLHAATVTTAFTIGGGVRSILDKDGAAIVVAAGADDYVSQPEGKAGARVACGVIKRADDTRKPHG